jgi:glycyl-tRNA synthetase beta chain
MSKDLVFEIGTEELPSSCVLEGISGLKTLLEEKLTQNRISFNEVKTYGTPRRLSAIVTSLENKQKPQEKIITGPPKKISFDSKGNPTAAVSGFAKGLNLNVGDLEEIETERGIYLGIRKIEEGKDTIAVLPDILKDVILSLSFNKQMAWGNYDIKFARPIRWILVLYGEEIIRFGIENLISSNATFGLRSLRPDPILIKNTGDYQDKLEKDGLVILDSARRKNLIISFIEQLEKNEWKGKFKAILDEGLINEVVNLVEIPNVLVGDFPEEFLYIPRDILIKAIQYHQRYFAVLDSNGNVSTKFIVIQNGIEDKSGEIIKGNARVLKARLSDARYFYEEDKKYEFESWFEKLKGVIFYSGLGTLYDKGIRLGKISIFIADQLSEKNSLLNVKDIGTLKEELKRASTLCKCDLVTNMVVEFPELQGIVGREYAKEKGEKKDTAAAIFEHYLPRFKGDLLPETEVGSILSIADKIDTIAGMFLVGNIPSGSQDPFALRRKASGIVLSSLKKNYNFDLQKLVSYSVDLYTDLHTDNSNEIFNFIIARYRFLLEKENKRTDILEAILGSGCTSILDIDSRYKSLEIFIRDNNIEEISTPMIRCKNIIKGIKFSDIKVELFREEFEGKLNNYIVKERAGIIGDIENGSYGDALLKLSDFGKVVNEFFDKVLVMDNDEKIRINRTNLVKNALDLYFLFADFSKLIITGNNNCKQ